MFVRKKKRYKSDKKIKKENVEMFTHTIAFISK